MEADAVAVDGQSDHSSHTPQALRRVLVVANQTLAGEKLQALVRQRLGEQPTQFHVVVPRPSPAAVFVDPSTGLVDPATERAHRACRTSASAAAEQRLSTFQAMLGQFDTTVTGEVVMGDPVVAAQRALAHDTYDEVIVSTLAPGISRWLRLDLPTRLARSCNVPITTIIQS